MSNELLYPYESDLPQSIEVQLKELLSSPAEKTTFTQEGNTIKIQKVSKKGIINVEAKSFSDANVITHMEVKKRDKKKDYKETISQMSDKGYSNNDISYLLDISPSYVSKLKK